MTTVLGAVVQHLFRVANKVKETQGNFLLSYSADLLVVDSAKQQALYLLRLNLAPNDFYCLENHSILTFLG